jgi:hypothetical protein
LPNFKSLKVFSENRLYFKIFDYFQDEKASQIHARSIEYSKESLENEGFFACLKIICSTFFMSNLSKHL